MRLLIITVLTFSGCQCLPGLQTTSALPVNVTPTTLVFEPTLVGTTRSLTLDVSNPNRAATPLEHAFTGPFEAAVPATLEGGGSQSLTIVFQPTEVGLSLGTLSLNGVVVALSGEGRLALECLPSSSCETSMLDPVAMQCVATLKPEGTVCGSRCISNGTCTAGSCVGQSPQCDDDDACTVDTCDEARGCDSSPRRCPSPAPCRIATCHPLTGCADEEAPDGTLCGPDDCLAAEMDVCITGACVKRTRPDTARCTNTWLPIGLGVVTESRLVFDEVNRVTVLHAVVAGRSQTWLWDGVRWAFQLPTNSPRGLAQVGLTWNPARQRVLLYGGMSNTGLPVRETWEWDGRTWLQLRPTRSPTCSTAIELAYEPTSRTVLMQCYSEASRERRLWRFTGATWEDLSFVPWTSNAHLFLDDATRTVTALESATFLDTWRWTGTGFQRTNGTATFNVVGPCWGVDPLTRETVAFVNSGADVRLWRFTNGELRSGPVVQGLRLQGSSGCTSAFDRSRGRLVVRVPTDGETREWDGHTFTVTEKAPSVSTSRLTTTPTGVALLGLGNGNQHFDWNGRHWREQSAAPSSPTPYFALAWDPPRQALVAHSSDLGSGTESTWFFDGGTWESLPSMTLPSGRPVMSWSPALGRLVLAKSASGALWHFDGTQWLPTMSDGGPGVGLDVLVMANEQSGWPVLLGTRGSGSVVAAYRFADAGWEQLAAPPVLSPLAGAFDPTRNVILTLGTAEDGGTSTLEWTGSIWSVRRPAQQPPSAVGSAAFDPINRRVLFFQPEATWVFAP